MPRLRVALAFALLVASAALAACMGPEAPAPSPAPSTSSGPSASRSFTYPVRVTCSTATWRDASLFRQAWALDGGDPTADHEVRPGFGYIAPPPTALAWNLTDGFASVIAIDRVTGRYQTPFGVALSDGPVQWVSVDAASEEEARALALEMLPFVTNASEEEQRRWVDGIHEEYAGHHIPSPSWRFQAEGPFHLPEALANLTQDDMLPQPYSGRIEADGWSATLRLPRYHLDLEHGYVQVLLGGGTTAVLFPKPTVEEAARRELAPHGLEPKAFDGLWASERRGPCLERPESS